VVHVAQPEEVLRWVPELSHIGKRLVTKSLPGPVAFQIKLGEQSLKSAEQRLGEAAGETIRDGYITFRCPDFAATQAVLGQVHAPVAIIGTGSATQPSAFEVSELPSPADSMIEAALDGGPTRYRKPSTLVKIDGEQFSVVRVGVMDERIIARMADFTMLFLCSGNTCRSPMAAALAGKLLADKLGIRVSELPLRHMVVKSAGLHANRGMRATLEAVDAVKPLGGDLSSHFSQPVTTDLLRRADVIYTMTNAHREEVLELLPGAEHKTFTVDPEGDVSDPIGSPLPVYEHVARRLSEVIQKRLSELPI
jgi:protein-tyrosine phosphatase